METSGETGVTGGACLITSDYTTDGHRNFEVMVQKGDQLWHHWHTAGAPPGPEGGAAGIRTPDLRRARAALSRLSYGPAFGPLHAHPLDAVVTRGGRAWTRTRDLGLIRAAL